MNRIISVKHGQKKKLGENEPAQPTYIWITDEAGAVSEVHELWTEDEEMDFLLGRLPIEHEKATADTDLTPHNPRQIKWRQLKPEDDEESAPLNLRREHRLPDSRKTVTMVAVQVPSKFEGLAANDTVLTILGGSGSYYIAALAERLQQIGGKMYQLPAYVLAERAGKDRDKSQDARLLTEIFAQEQNLFYFMEEQDKKLVILRDAVYALLKIMRDRIACGQRIVQRLRAETFQQAARQSNSEWSFNQCPPDLAVSSSSEIAIKYQQALEEDVIYQGMVKKEKEAEKRVAKLLDTLPVYKKVFEPVERCGPKIAMRIITAVADIRRFPTLPKFCRFCGVHVNPDGTFPRSRKKQPFPGNPLARQAFYLFVADQCNKAPASHWGKVLRAYKAKFRALHPEVEVVNGKKRYTNAHIHKMGIWRTATKFAEHIYKSWRWLELARQGKAIGEPPQPIDPQSILAQAEEISSARQAA